MRVVILKSISLAPYSFYMADSKATRKTLSIKDLQPKAVVISKENWILTLGPIARAEARKRHLARPGVK
jgi:hypothetical protein